MRKPIAIYQIEGLTEENSVCWSDTTKDRYEDTIKRGFKGRIIYASKIEVHNAAKSTKDAS